MWSLIGLLLDLIGVFALGYDLVRIQRAMLVSARANLDAYMQFDADFGGTADWLNDLKKSLRWVKGSEFQEHHAQEEVSYNAERVVELAKDVADAAAGLGEYLIGLAAILRTRAGEDVNASGTSLKFSYLGLGLIFAGFLLQFHGSAIQMCRGSASDACTWVVWL
jgi:hypothetical protein